MRVATKTHSHRQCQFTFCYRSFALAASLVIGALYLGQGITAEKHAWFAWGGLLPLLVALRVFAPRKAAAAGMIWGLGVFVAALLSPPVGARIPTTAVSLFALVVLPASYATAGSLLVRRVGYNPFALAAAWIGVEFLLPHLGLKQGLLCALHFDASATHLIASLLGPAFVAFLVVLANALVVCILQSITRVIAERSGTTAPGAPPRRHSAFLDTPAPKWYERFPSHPRAPPVPSLEHQLTML